MKGPTKLQLRVARREMAAAGAAMMEERGGEFCFGEWAGESEREIIEIVTGLDFDALDELDVDSLCESYLAGEVRGGGGARVRD